MTNSEQREPEGIIERDLRSLLMELGANYPDLTRDEIIGIICAKAGHL